jgi:hypothetical protein
MKINLLDKGRLDAKIRNNELRGDIDYSKFKSQIDELKKNSLYLNSQNNREINRNIEIYSSKTQNNGKIISENFRYSKNKSNYEENNNL